MSRVPRVLTMVGRAGARALPVPLVALTIIILWLCGVAPASDEPASPAATVSIDAYLVGAGLGLVAGNGTLTYQGKDYTFTVSGFTVGDLGVSNSQARGSVYNLTSVADFAGTYVGMGAGVTVVGGKGTIQLKNQRGVIVELQGEGRGLNVAFGPTGAKFELQRQPKPARMR